MQSKHTFRASRYVGSFSSVGAAVALMLHSSPAPAQPCPGLQALDQQSKLTTSDGSAFEVSGDGSSIPVTNSRTQCNVYSATQNGTINVLKGGQAGNAILNNGRLHIRNGGQLIGYAAAGEFFSNTPNNTQGVFGTQGTVTVDGGGLLGTALIGAGSALTVGSGSSGDPVAKLGWITTSGTTLIQNTEVDSRHAFDLGRGSNEALINVRGGATHVIGSTLQDSAAPLGTNAKIGILVTPGTGVSGSGVTVNDPVVTVEDTTINNVGTGVQIQQEQRLGEAISTVNIVNSLIMADANSAVAAVSTLPGPSAANFVTLLRSNLIGIRGIDIEGGNKSIDLMADSTNITAKGAGATSGVLLKGTAQATFTNNTVITGVTHGIEMIPFRPSNPEPGALITLSNNASAIGQSGAGIFINGAVDAQVQITSGATLTGGNGNLVQLDSGDAKILTDNVTLTGNIVGSTGQLGLFQQNNSTITGNLQALLGATVTSTMQQATMTGDVSASDVGSSLTLAMGADSTLTGNLFADNNGILTAALNGSSASITGGTRISTGGEGHLLVANGAQFKNSNNAAFIATDEKSKLNVHVVGGQVQASGKPLLDANEKATASIITDGWGAKLQGDIKADNSAAVAITMGGLNASLLGNITADHGATTTLGMTGTHALMQGNTTLSNGSTATISLDGQNNTLWGDIAVGTGSQGTVKVAGENNRLRGDLRIGDPNTDILNIDLASSGSQDSPTLLGNVTATNMSLSNGAYWQFGAASPQRIQNKLTVNNGIIDFGSGPYKTLEVGTLEQNHGSSLFIMRTDFSDTLPSNPPPSNNGTDLLTVSQALLGTHELSILNTSPDREGVTNPRNNIPVANTAISPGILRLQGDSIGIGNYNYTLVQQGEQWVLQRSGGGGDNGNGGHIDPIIKPKDLSPSAQAALALASTAPLIWQGELGILRKRQGELRHNKSASGLWGRTYSNITDIEETQAPSYRLKQYGLTIGVDKYFPQNSGGIYAGVLAAYSYSTLDINNNASGKVNSLSLGGYATWISNNGWYVDTVIKANSFQNTLRTSSMNSAPARGQYRTPGIGTSIEVGKHIQLTQNSFIEPYVRGAAFIARSSDPRLSNGFNYHVGSDRSVQGELGMFVGSNISLKGDWLLQPYIRAAVLNEFTSSDEVILNADAFDSDLSGTQAVVGIGMTLQAKDQLQFHIDLDYASGKPVNNAYSLTLGAQYRW